jgi:hypothetical protein
MNKYLEKLSDFLTRVTDSEERCYKVLGAGAIATTLLTIYTLTNTGLLEPWIPRETIEFKQSTKSIDSKLD